MFTGIIEHVGRIQAFEKNAINKEALDKSAFGKAAVETTGDGPAQSSRLRVHAGPLAASLAVSNSIAVNGCCLTVVEIAGETFAADLSSETLRRTSFGEITPGTPVNLERPMTAGKEFGGHFVQGHVDGIARVVRWEDRWEAGGATWWLGVRLPPELARYVIFKGSLCIEGISLTVAQIEGTKVSAAIIPHTVKMTNLKSLKPGDPVNLEVDLVAKYVEKMIKGESANSSLTVKRLVREGF